MKRSIATIILTSICLFLNSQTLLENLPELGLYETNYMFSSYDPTGQNFDGYRGGNYLYSTKKGSIHIDHPQTTADSSQLEYVMVDIKGPGVLKRFWNARYELNDTVRIYVDGQPEPLIALTIKEMFYDKLSPFDQGLTYDYSQNTGALLTYRPVFFNQSLIITIDNPIGYYHFNVAKYIDGFSTEIDPEQYITELQHLFLKAGDRPDAFANGNIESQTFSLEPGASKVLIEKSGTNTIHGLEIVIPTLDKVNTENLLEDDFKVSIGRNTFWMKTAPVATNYKLRYRVLRKVGQTSALVFINGVYADTWETDPVPIRDNIWVDYEFNIPAILALNNDSIKIELVPLENDWAGFTYWMVCGNTITDSLDVGNVESEAAHGYNNLLEGLSGTMKGRYEYDESIAEQNTLLLKSLQINAFWDDEANPSIDCEAAYFFGLGEIDAPVTNGICMGFNENGLYNYLPMPFAQKGKLVISNTNDSVAIENITVSLSTSPGMPDNGGYLHTQFNSYSTNPGYSDVELLSTYGQGKMVALVLNGNGPQIRWLEGDERVYIDRLKSPLIHGTGTEDLFNGGDYFLLGERDLPLGSLNYSVRNYANMFRTFLPDPINYRDGLVFNLQRGADNDIVAQYNALAFYYSNSETDPYIQSDYFNISQDINPILNNYIHYGGIYFNQSGFYEGTYDAEPFNNKGYARIDSSEFQVNIPANNGGLVLIRGLNYAYENQEASVFVNGNYAGSWLTAGKNESKVWREDIFIIPPSITQGEEEVQVKMVSNSGNWTEMYYTIHTLGADAVISNVHPSTFEIGSKLFPNPFSSVAELIFEPDDQNVSDIRIIDLSGQLVRQYHKIHGSRLSIERGDLKDGLYFIQIVSNYSGKLISSTSMLLGNSQTQ